MADTPSLTSGKCEVPSLTSDFSARIRDEMFKIVQSILSVEEELELEEEKVRGTHF